MIKAEIVADSINLQGDRLTSLLVTFPRIILAEVNTHRMLSKNTSSSRAIPFKKMVEAVQNDPFIPIAWQREHSGMQGSEYIIDEERCSDLTNDWLEARDNAVKIATRLNFGFYIDKETGFGEDRVTKQLCNRLLEPFMWTTMLITGSKEGWDNFFKLRCPSYEVPYPKEVKKYKSKKEVRKENHNLTINYTDLNWLELNKGQAEIHIMDLAEKIYDAMNASTPKELQAGEWHIPFNDVMDAYKGDIIYEPLARVKISTAMAARTSYTVVGDEKEIDYRKMIDLHDRLIAQNPPHSSPMEHCARAMNSAEYESFYKGQIGLGGESGWCRNFKGFIQYRHIIENGA